jgi:hypothetical protein
VWLSCGSGGAAALGAAQVLEASKGPFAADKLRFEVAQSVPCLHAIGSRSDCCRSVGAAAPPHTHPSTREVSSVRPTSCHDRTVH